MVFSGEAAERSMSDDSRSAISMAPVLLPFLGSRGKAVWGMQVLLFIYKCTVGQGLWYIGPRRQLSQSRTQNSAQRFVSAPLSLGGGS